MRFLDLVEIPSPNILEKSNILIIYHIGRNRKGVIFMSNNKLMNILAGILFLVSVTYGGYAFFNGLAYEQDSRVPGYEATQCVADEW
jgi:hypothetical protein